MFSAPLDSITQWDLWFIPCNFTNHSQSVAGLGSCSGFLYLPVSVSRYIAANHIGKILWISKNTSKLSKFSKLKFTIFSKRSKNILVLIYFDFIIYRYRKKSYLLTLSNWNPGNWGVSLIKEAMFKDFYQALREVLDCPNIFWFAESLWNFLFCFWKW